MTSRVTGTLQARRTSRPSTPALIELPAPPTVFRRTVAAVNLLAPEDRLLVAEGAGTMCTPVSASSPTPKALPSSLKTLDSGYESKLKGPQVDYFSVEQSGTTAEKGEHAPLASPQPLHMEHHSSLPSRAETVKMAPKQDALAEVAQQVPRAATDSSLLFSNPKLVADDSVWDCVEPQKPGPDGVTSDKSDESEASFKCCTSAAIERLTVAQIILKGNFNQGDSPLDRRMSL